MTDNTILFFDIETFSETPIRNGTFAYAEDAEVMILSWAFGYDTPAEVHDLTVDPRIPNILRLAVADPSITIVGQNFGNFDRNVLRLGRLPDGAPADFHIPVERIHDTMVQAMSHGLPGSLDKLGEIFDIREEDAKIKEGRDLIQLFCKPRPKNQALRRATRHTHPAEWKRFLDYAKSDITAMRHIYRHMPRWNYPGESIGNRQAQEYRLWCLDQKINDRGILMDTELARHAIDAVNKAQKNLNDKVDDMTFGEVERASQRDRLLKHLLSYYDVDLPDMSKATLEKRVADPDLPEPVRELIAIRLESAQTANSKYNALLKGVSDDDRLRGTLQFCGASRTGRWAGRVFQPQNLPRPKMKAAQIEQEIEVIKMGASDTLLWRSPISAASDAIRGTIIAPSGRKLVVADLSNIEGRTAAWLAGEQWKLQAFRDYDAGVGPDLYLLTAGGILGIRPDEVSKDQRQSYGKTSELACNYQGAVGAFQTMAAMFGLEFTDEKAWEIVRGWRAKNPNIVALWEQLQTAAWNAVTGGGEHSAGKIVFEKWKNWLKMHLPSSRVLCYAAPSIIEDPKKKGRSVISYMGLNSYTRRWQRLTTYGGKLFENANQAVARDVIAHGLELADDAGFSPVLTVHDEIICETLDTPNYSVDRLAAFLSRVPDWADDSLPLSAAGFEGYRYRKD